VVGGLWVVAEGHVQHRGLHGVCVWVVVVCGVVGVGVGGGGD
jgi:hypothetical protein